MLSIYQKLREGGICQENLVRLVTPATFNHPPSAATPDRALGERGPAMMGWHFVRQIGGQVRGQVSFRTLGPNNRIVGAESEFGGQTEREPWFEQWPDPALK